MRNAKFIWLDHPQQPEVVIKWQFDRVENTYHLISLHLDQQLMAENTAYHFEDQLVYSDSSYPISMLWDDYDLYLSAHGLSYHFRHKPSFMELIESEQSDGLVQAVMPGKILKVNVIVDQSVIKGETLLIMESMKMENKILAPRDGKVSSIMIREGDLVQAEQQLIVIEGHDE